MCGILHHLQGNHIIILIRILSVLNLAIFLRWNWRWLIMGLKEVCHSGYFFSGHPRARAGEWSGTALPLLERMGITAVTEGANSCSAETIVAVSGRRGQPAINGGSPTTGVTRTPKRWMVSPQELPRHPRPSVRLRRRPASLPLPVQD